MLRKCAARWTTRRIALTALLRPSDRTDGRNLNDSSSIVNGARVFRPQNLSSESRPCRRNRVLSGLWLCEPGLERGDPCGELLVLVARASRHVSYSLEFLTADDVHASHHPLQLAAGKGLSLPPRAVGEARRVRHEAPEIVEGTTVGLRHRSLHVCALGFGGERDVYVARTRIARKGARGKPDWRCPA